MRPQTLVFGAVLMLFSFAGFSCSRYDTNPADVPDPAQDDVLVETSSSSVPVEDAGQDESEKSDQSAPIEPRQLVLGGGCFWCVEAVYDQLNGVLDVESGYAGGEAETATYNLVSTGRTKHAEVVRITYDPSVITIGKILKVFFSTAHDPTTLNRQGADVGPQYRSAIFYANETEQEIASAYIKQLNESGVFRDPIVTTLEPLEAYYPAEAYHQDYAAQNPNDGYIQGVSAPKVEKTRKAYSDLLKDDQ